METNTETTGGIKKATRPRKRNNAEPENPNPQPSEGLGTGDGAGTGIDPMGPVAAAPDGAEGEAKRGRGRPPGSTKAAAAVPLVECTAAEGTMVVSAIGQFKAWVFTKFLGVPLDLAPIVAYDNEQAATIGAVAAPVIQKWMPKNLGKWKEEFQLALVVFSVEQLKYQQLQLAIAERAAQAAAGTPAAGLAAAAGEGRTQ